MDKFGKTGSIESKPLIRATSSIKSCSDSKSNLKSGTSKVLKVPSLDLLLLSLIDKEFKIFIIFSSSMFKPKTFGTLFKSKIISLLFSNCGLKTNEVK